MNKEEISKLLKDNPIKIIKFGDIEVPVEYLKQTTVNINGDDYIRLQQENKKLREKYKATNKGLIKVLSKRLKWKRRYYKEKYIRKELKKWLEEVLNGLKENDIYDRTPYEIGQIVVIESIIAKIEELEEGVK